MYSPRVNAMTLRRIAVLGSLAAMGILNAPVAYSQAPPGGANPPPSAVQPSAAPPTASSAGGLPGGAAPGGGPPPPGFIMPAWPPLTDAQKLVKALPPPQPGGLPPYPETDAHSPMPSADPRDFTGTWIHSQPLQFRMQNDMFGMPAPYTMAGAQVLARRVISLNHGKPFMNASSICRPPGPEWQRDLNMPFHVYPTKTAIEFLFEEYHGRWYVIMDPKQAPAPADREYMGYSTGKWDGSTLVVTTTGFKQGMYLDVDGTPLSRNGTLIQRIRKVDNGDYHPYLQITTTIIDPLYYTRPWSVVRSFAWVPGLDKMKEYNCEEQIGDPTVSADAGLVHEPQD